MDPRTRPTVRGRTTTTGERTATTDCIVVICNVAILCRAAMSPSALYVRLPSQDRVKTPAEIAAERARKLEAMEVARQQLGEPQTVTEYCRLISLSLKLIGGFRDRKGFEA